MTMTCHLTLSIYTYNISDPVFRQDFRYTRYTILSDGYGSILDFSVVVFLSPWKTNVPYTNRYIFWGFLTLFDDLIIYSKSSSVLC